MEGQHARIGNEDQPHANALTEREVAARHPNESAMPALARPLPQNLDIGEMVHGCPTRDICAEIAWHCPRLCVKGLPNIGNSCCAIRWIARRHWETCRLRSGMRRGLCALAEQAASTGAAFGVLPRRT